MYWDLCGAEPETKHQNMSSEAGSGFLILGLFSQHFGCKGLIRTTIFEIGRVSSENTATVIYNQTGSDC